MAPEQQDEVGYGEVCRLVDESKPVELDFLLNCTQGIQTHNYQHRNKYYDTVIDLERMDNDTFWLKDQNQFIFLPFNPLLRVELRIRDFKYLADSYDFRTEVDDPDQLLGKKVGLCLLK